VFWRQLAGDFEPVPGMVRGSLRVFGPMVVAVMLLEISAMLGGRSAGQFASALTYLSGIASLVVAQATALRSYARTMQQPFADPQPALWYLWWAALWTTWPMAVALAFFVIVAPAIAEAFGSRRPFAPVTSAFSAVVVLLSIVQNWAYSYVAVDGYSAGDAIAGVLNRLRDRAVFARIAIFTTIVSAAEFVNHLFGGLAAHWRWAPMAIFAFSIIPAVLAYPYFWAALLRTRPSIDEPLAVPT
jgi:hypothetical protein